MIVIENIDGGYRVTHTVCRWTWWVYPSELEIRNNGERYKQTGRVTAPRLDLPPNWTLGMVIDAILARQNKDY